MPQYQEGYDVGYAGLSNSKNPYEKGSKEYDEWLDGWVDGRTIFDRDSSTTMPAPTKFGDYL
jgi:ribosome modulation factor